MARRPAIHVRLHPDLHKKLMDECESDHLDRSAVVTIALNEHFAKRAAEGRQRR